MRRSCSVYAVICTVFAVFCFCGCRADHGKRHDDNTLIIASPHPLVLIIPVIQNFENETGIDVRIVQGGTGEIIENILRYPDAAPYDLLWGGSYSSILPVSSLFETYISINEPFVQDAYKNTEGVMTRFSDIPSVIMINKKRLGPIPVTGYTDLLDPRLNGAIAFADPGKSSSSWEHLINMLYAEGGSDPEKGWNYVERFCQNLDGNLLDGSKDVYTGVAEGKFAAGLTFEEGGANYAENDRNIELVYMKEGVVFTPDGACLLKNAPHAVNAKRFIDYTSGASVQNYISKQLNRRSIRRDIYPKRMLPMKDRLPCISADYTYAASHKEQWIQHFHDIFDSTVKGRKHE